jgi:hypothetical protein
MMADNNGNNNGDVFVYMGGDQEVPEDVTHVRVHKSVKIIPRQAFIHCTNLVSIEMHDGVEIIEEKAFEECESLRGIKLSGVRVIEYDAFCDCTKLEDVEFGNKLEIIEDWAFAFTSLRSIKLPKVRVIGNSAFYSCKYLVDVELSENLERIGNWAFESSSPRNVKIPLNTGMIEGAAFVGCDALSQVDLIGGIHKSISSLLLDRWRNDMKNKIDRINQVLPGTPAKGKTEVINQWIGRVLGRMEQYKSKHYALLKNNMSLLELALWKTKLRENI